GHADNEPIRWPQRLFIKLNARVEHACFIARVHFQAAVMRCGHNMSTTNSAELIDHGHTQGRTFLGIGSSSHLIEQNQRGSFADFNHARDICDVRSEGGKVCSKRLMIANMSEHGSIEW